MEDDNLNPSQLKAFSMQIPLYEFLCSLLRHHLGFLSGLRDHGSDFFETNRQIPHLVATLFRAHDQLPSSVYLIPVLKRGNHDVVIDTLLHVSRSA